MEDKAYYTTGITGGVFAGEQRKLVFIVSLSKLISCSTSFSILKAYEKNNLVAPNMIYRASHRLV